MEKIPSTTDYLLNNSLYKPRLVEIVNKLIKMHVKAALQEASKKVRLTDFASEFLQEGASDAIDKDSIIKAYSEENIK